MKVRGCASAVRLAGMPGEPLSAASCEPAIDQWRVQTTRLLMGLVVITATLRMPMVLFRWPLLYGRGACMAFVLLYAWLLVTVLVPRMGHRTRLSSFVVAGYALGAFQLVRSGLAGDGRLTLVTIPLVVLAMAGNGPGWVAMGASAVIYVCAAFAMDRGMLSGALIFQANPTDLMTWSVLGIAAACHVLALGGIFMGLLNVHRKLLRAERQATIQLREEAARREAAFLALEKETRERERLEAALLNAGEEERRLMGAEVHDGLCQQLTAALLNCAAAERRSEKDHAQATQDIQLTRTLLEQSIDEAYGLAHRLSPLQSSGMDLSLALSRLAQQTQRSAQITCSYQERGDAGPVDPHVGAHLYRIAQEAVRNAIRHAKASEVILEHRRDPDAIHLRIVDDGVGIREPAGAAPGGMGMRTMAYRAGLIGARLSIGRGDTGGTVVDCTLASA